jgi:O-antigen ligase
VWHAALEMIVRYRVAIVVELGMIAAWFVLRTFVGVESRWYLAWTVTASAIALTSPASGLVILLATAPFYEPVTLTRALGQREVLVGALGIAVALRLALGGWRRMTWTAPVLLAVAVGLVTALGVLNTWRLFPADWATHAAQTWLATVGGAMILLLVGVWVAGTGARRFVVAAVVAAIVAVGLSLVELLAHGSISGSRLAWVGFWKDFGPRLGGAIASPNGMAALAVMPVCVLAATAVLGQGRLLRAAAGAGAALMFVAMYVTYSRAALLSLFGLAVVVAWRIRRRLGQAVLVVGIVVGIVLLPKYLQIRGDVGSVGAVEPGSFLVATDRDRFTAWGTAIAMLQEQPLLGQGFLAYKQLGNAYGDPVLSSPHNEWLRLFAEEGVVAGGIGLLFVATTLSWLIRSPGAIGAGILAGTAGYFTMATFNNPFLYIQISAVIYPLMGFALVLSIRARHREGTLGLGSDLTS